MNQIKELPQIENNTESFNTFCPLFPGFYGTVFEYDNEDGDIDFYNDENGTELGYDDFKWNYAEHNLRVVKSFTNRIESELKHLLPVTINFQELQSPKEYNFSNDAINIEVKLNLSELISLVNDRKEKAAQYFADKYTSCSGFISFHSPDIENWLNEDYIREKESHRVGALLDCLCSIEIPENDIYYYADSENYIDFTPVKN